MFRAKTKIRYRSSMTMDPRLVSFERLVRIIDRLRAPDGCPWDREQTLQSMAPCILEEVYELLETLDAETVDTKRPADGGADGDADGGAEQAGPDEGGRGAGDETCLELGDVLMNCLLMARIAEDDARFSLGDVAEQISDKLVRRHPHVFGDAEAKTGEEALGQWAKIKAAERAGAEDETARSALAGVPRELPALLRALRVGEKASRTGFDWPDASGPMSKVEEELEELRVAIDRETPERVREELGDLLFSITNLARHVGVDPEGALRSSIDKFSSRFRAVERDLGPRMGEAPLAEMEEAWQRAKA